MWMILKHWSRCFCSIEDVKINVFFIINKNMHLLPRHFSVTQIQKIFHWFVVFVGGRNILSRR